VISDEPRSGFCTSEPEASDRSVQTQYALHGNAICEAALN
jgi:hypothetical protein